MYELIQVSELCYYIQCPAKIGVVRTDENNVVLIDSGNDKNAGKKPSKYWNSVTGAYRRFSIPIPTPTTSAGTVFYRSAQAVKFTRPA